jgi:spermidine synthase
VAGIAGFAFFLMELVWNRMLGPILGGTTFTFGLILAVALLGIGLGGAAYALFCRRMPVSLHSLAVSCVVEACCIAVPFALGDRLAVMAAHFREAAGSHFLGELGGWAVITSIVVLPAAVASGLQFSLLIGLLGQGDQDVGKQVGFAFSFNTVGAICGALAGGFGLLPLLSAPGVWRSVVALLTIIGVCVFTHSWRLARRRVFAIATLVAGVAAVGMIVCPGPTAVWRHGAVGAGRGGWATVLADPNSLRDWENSVRRSVLWEADGVESSVAIVGSDSLAFYVNGMCDGNAIADAGTQIMLGLIGAVLHPQPRTAFVVGLGTGETAGWLADVPSIERVDVVELEPSVQEMARRCRDVNHDVLANPKVRLIFNDAREVLRTTAAHYDLIACEPSNPYRNGIANLFTREFYLAGRDRLNDGGIFAQWIQAYEIDERTMRTVFATLKSVFSHVELWQTKGGDLVLLGSNRKPEYSVSKLRAKVATEPFASALSCAWHTTDLEGLFSHYVGGEALINRFIGEGAASINTDDHNEIEYGFARNLGRNTWDSQGILYRKSVEIGDQRPPVGTGAVDWQAVTLGRQWDATVRDVKKLTADDLTLEPAVGDKILVRYIAKDAWGTLYAWEAQPPSAPCLTELAVVAHLYAESGNNKAEPLIERLRDRMPAEAELLGGILAYKQQRTSEAGERLATALRRFRTDPWVLEHIMVKSFDAAVNVARADPGQAPKLLQAFAEPFPVYCADENRRATAGVIAEQLSPATVAQCVASFEPHVPWSKRFLTYRLKAYENAGDTRAVRARQDLDAFVRNTAN